MDKMYLSMKLLVNISLLFFSFTLSIIFTEYIISSLNFPKEYPWRITHPINYTEFRNNIEFEYEFRTNSLGFRDKERVLKKPENNYRIFVTGDSFTEGFGVDEESRFTNLLEINNIEYINGGLSGTGPIKYGRAFLNAGLKYDPDGLLICYNLNDLNDMPIELPEHLFYRNIDRTGIRKFIHSVIPCIYTQIKTFRIRLFKDKKQTELDYLKEVTDYANYLEIPKTRIFDWIQSIPDSLLTAVNENRFNGSILSHGLFYPESMVDIIEMKSPRSKVKWNNTCETLSKLISEANKRDIAVGIVLIPASCQYDINILDVNNPTIIGGTIIKKEWQVGKSEIQIHMENWCKKNSINYLDLTPIFRKQIQRDEKSYNYYMDGHWNELGHKVAADAIDKWIKKEKLFFLNR
jgi:hypothetical protein